MQLTVGRVGRVQGNRGEVAVEVRTDDPDSRFAPGMVLLTDPEQVGPLTVGRVRWQGNRLIVRFRNVPDRTAAEALRGVLLLVDVDDSERLPDPDEFYDHQLVGLHAVTSRGVDIGEVTEVLHLPAHELLAVRREDGTEVLVPFVSQIVSDIDLAERVVTIDPPGGLLEAEPEA